MGGSGGVLKRINYTNGYDIVYAHIKVWEVREFLQDFENCIGVTNLCELSIKLVRSYKYIKIIKLNSHKYIDIK